MSVQMSRIVKHLMGKLDANPFLTSIQVNFSDEQPELDTLRANTIYVIREGPMLEEQMFGPTDLYSCTNTFSFVAKPDTKKIVPSFHVGTEILMGERLISRVLAEMVKELKDIDVPGVNLAGHGISQTNQTNTSGASGLFYLGEVSTQTIYEG